MTHSTVAAKVHKALDIHGYGTTQITLNGELSNLCAKGFDFGLRQLSDLGVRLHSSRLTNSVRGRPTDTVNRRQCNHCVFLIRYINPGYASHESFLLSETDNGTSRNA
jgi:hypothetical protein